MGNISAKELRGGFTTGSCAAAAAKAAAMTASTGEEVRLVTICLPAGDEIPFCVAMTEHSERMACYRVIKDAGDDPDITNGLAIEAQVKLDETGDITIQGGAGVGTITKPGLQLQVGAPAINPIPLGMIRHEVRSVISESRGAVVTVCVPQGALAAKRTMNPRLGIVGGISILGTSGRVRPMSDEAWMKSLIPQLDIAQACGYKGLLLVPGQIGEKLARDSFSAPQEMIAQSANFIGIMLDEAAQRKFDSVLIMGHHGKLLKLAGGIFNTHSKIADARAEIVAAHAAMQGASRKTIAKIMEAPAAEGMLAILDSQGMLEDVYASIAQAGAEKCRSRMQQRNAVMTVHVALFDYEGRLLAHDGALSGIGGIEGWLTKYSL